jgi:hypothetical protein
MIVGTGPTASVVVGVVVGGVAGGVAGGANAVLSIPIPVEVAAPVEALVVSAGPLPEVGVSVRDASPADIPVASVANGSVVVVVFGLHPLSGLTNP